MPTQKDELSAKANFFFRATVQCVGPSTLENIPDAVDALDQQIQDLETALADGEIPPPPRTLAKIAKVKAFIQELRQQLRALIEQLQAFQSQNP